MEPKTKITHGGLRTGAMAGVFLMLGAMFCFLGTMFGMMRAFSTLGDAGIVDPKALSNNVAAVSYLAPRGMILFTCGLTLLVVCRILLYQARRDERGKPLEGTGYSREVLPLLPPEK